MVRSSEESHPHGKLVAENTYASVRLNCSQAARKAHPDIQLNPDDLITEPEAAALFTFEAYSRRGLSVRAT